MTCQGVVEPGQDRTWQCRRHCTHPSHKKGRPGDLFVVCNSLQRIGQGIGRKVLQDLSLVSQSIRAMHRAGRLARICGTGGRVEAFLLPEHQVEQGWSRMG